MAEADVQRSVLPVPDRRYPYCDDLNMVAMGHPNVHVCLSLLVPWALTAPWKFARILGGALRFVGPERIIWGTDAAGFGAQVAAAVIGLRDFQMRVRRARRRLLAGSMLRAPSPLPAGPNRRLSQNRFRAGYSSGDVAGECEEP